MKFLAFILYPFSIIYGLIAAIRNMLYDLSFFKQCKTQVPTICVGNLSYGGTGKTPHVEYLIRLLSSSQTTAILSRGYKRKTSGFVMAEDASTSNEIGDEPKQYKTKFPNVSVAVCEDRCKGVARILEVNPNTNCILLDDAFQHRAINAGLYILLSDFNNLFTRDHVIPAGTLREFRCGAKRADIIIVTKCPTTLTIVERERINKEINPKKRQNLFFSFIKYDQLVRFNDPMKQESLTNFKTAIIFSGIGNINPLEEYLVENHYSLHSMKFGDHHQFSDQNLIKLKETFNIIAERRPVIITTQKDAMRIETSKQKEILKDLPLYYIPIQFEFFPTDKEMFNNIILKYVANA